jgi:hypothetical protein
VRGEKQVSEDKLIEECMDWFEFERVHKAMVLLDWKWGMDDEAAVPDLPEIRKAARKFIRAAIEQCTGKKFTVGSGGFEATAYRDPDGVLEGVMLRFVLADWYADVEDLNEDSGE